MARRRYRRRGSNSGAAIVGDVISTANRTPWWMALLLGVTLWLIFAVGLPLWIEHQQAALDGNMFHQMVEQIFSRRIHWLAWVCNACLTASAFFAIKNYFWQQPFDREQRRFAAFIARVLGRSID